MPSGGGTGHTHWHGVQQSFKTWTFAWFSLSPQGNHCSILPTNSFVALALETVVYYSGYCFFPYSSSCKYSLSQTVGMAQCLCSAEALFLPFLCPLPHPPYIHPYSPFISSPLFSLILNKFTEDHYMDLHHKLWLHKTQVPAPTKRHNNSMTERHNIWCNCYYIK